MKATVRIDMKILALATLVLTATLILGGAVFTLAATGTLTVDVTVDTTTEITLVPSTLQWTSPALVVGTAGSAKNVDVKNSGSQALTTMYVNGDTLADEATRPYGTSTSTNYASAGVLKIANESSSTYYWIGRTEWNWTEDISSMTKNVTSPVAWGFYKNASSEFVWSVGNGTGGRCNETGSQFKIESDADAGTAATRTPDVPATYISGDQYWGYFSINSEPLPGNYCIAVNQTCDKVYIYKFDQRATGATNFATCTVDSPLTVPINPGDISSFSIQPYVPKGIPAGSMSTATITFTAST